MDPVIKVNGLPKNYYRDRYYEYSSRFYKMKIAYEQAMEKLRFKEQQVLEYKLECDKTWETMQLQTEYIKDLESSLYKYEHQEGKDEII